MGRLRDPRVLEKGRKESGAWNQPEHLVNPISCCVNVFRAW